ncbi:MAG: hypothetical protein HY600_01320 [Candidatus Omnitrophica bacterium]|nr:hypothetical protein [Candidatus Omnitrophota bacterium]
MRYVIYGLWAGAWYVVLVLLQQWSGRPVRPFPLACAALVSAIVFKRHLPVLKDLRFPELIAISDRWRARIAGLELRPKVCAACGRTPTLSLRYSDQVGRNLEPKSVKAFCRSCGLRVWRESLERFRGSLLCAEPDVERAPGASGSFFYEPGDLRIHGYSSADRAVVERLLEGMAGEGELRVGWLPKDVLGVCDDPPLVKRDVAPERITVGELISRIEKTLFWLETARPRAEYWIMAPRGVRGIYLWDEV